MPDHSIDWLLANDVEHLQRVLDRARMGTFEHDSGSTVVRVSPLACALFGFEPRRELLLAEMLARIHPDDLPARNAAYERALCGAGDGFYDVQYRVGPPDFARWVEVRGVVVHADAPQRRRVVGVMSDITEQKRREDSFASMEAMLDAIGNSTDAFIFAKDLQGRMIYCNDAVLRSIGRTRDEVIGHTDQEFLGPGETTEAIMAHDARVLRQGRTEVFTETLEHVGKKYLSTKTPFRDARGNLVGLAGVSIDITELEGVRSALAEVEERASLAAEAAGIGIFDWDPRTDRLAWTDTLREQFGMDLAQEVTLQVALARVHPEDRERVSHAVQRALDPAGDGRYGIEYRTVPVDGEIRWLHVLGRVRFEERDGRREPVRFSGVSVNITRLKGLEEQLRFQLDLTRNITDNATTAIFMMDEHSRCTFMNPAAERMTGYAFDEIRGGVLHDFIHHHHADGRPYPMRDCPIDRALPEQFDVIAHEDVFVRKDGEFFPVVVNAKPIRKGGVAVGTVIEVRDVTVERETVQRLRELSANLAEADRRKDEFLATLAHELRNPLSPIRTAASLMESPRLQPEQLAWASKVIRRQVSHMARLLDDLLDVARITRGKLAIERRSTSLAEVVEAAVEAVRPLVDEKEHSLVVDLPRAEAVVCVDPYRVSQILTNLLTNAARYTDLRGRIELRCALDGDDATFSVADNGPGLEPAELGSVFEMFAQGRAGEGGRGTGLGIGLALSRALAQLHGGDLLARSDGPGCGSVFELRLPGSVRSGGPASPGSAPPPARRKRVLVADDNRDAVDALAIVLQLQGHDTRVAYGGRDAISLARQFKPEFVVLDLGMPDLTGYEVVRILRRDAWAAATQFIALSGWGQQVDKDLARDAGFHAHVTKPAEPAELSALLAAEPQQSRTAADSV